jgi:hypothetical protein
MPMMLTNPPLERAAAVLIRRTIRVMMADYALREVKMNCREDHAGSPALFIDVYYDLNDVPYDPGLAMQVIHALRNELWAMGEERFPYVKNHFDENQPILKSVRRKKA